MNLLNVEGYNNFKKDTSSGGIVNVDKNSYESYKLSKNIAQRNLQQQKAAQESVINLQNQINTINDDLVDIKNMLLQLLQKGN